MTNREAHEQAAGMGLEESFFSFNGIDPEAEYIGPLPVAIIHELKDFITAHGALAGKRVNEVLKSHEFLRANLTAAQRQAAALLASNTGLEEENSNLIKQKARDEGFIRAHAGHVVTLEGYLANATSQLTAAQERIQLLEGAIEGAEHGRHCKSHVQIVGLWHEVYFKPTDEPCNCFKAVLAPKETTA